MEAAKSAGNTSGIFSTSSSSAGTRSALIAVTVTTGGIAIVLAKLAYEAKALPKNNNLPSHQTEPEGLNKIEVTYNRILRGCFAV
jgi:hypothetical protein